MAYVDLADLDENGVIFHRHESRSTLRFKVNVSQTARLRIVALAVLLDSICGDSMQIHT